jgi:transcription termination/antitermination protein NusA
MTRIKYDINLMKFISFFENLTRSKVKDCIDSGSSLIYVVQKGEIGKAIGKNASNIKKVENMLKRKVRVIEFNEDVAKFVRNVLAPIKVEEVELVDSKVVIRDPNMKIKGMIIGRDASNLKKHKEIVSRYFPIEDIVVER